MTRSIVRRGGVQTTFNDGGGAATVVPTIGLRDRIQDFGRQYFGARNLGSMTPLALGTWRLTSRASQRDLVGLLVLKKIGGEDFEGGGNSNEDIETGISQSPLN